MAVIFGYLEKRALPLPSDNSLLLMAVVLFVACFAVAIALFKNA